MFGHAEREIPVLENWGISDEEVEAALAETTQRKRDNRVCACGHPAKAHTSESDSDYHRTLKAAGRSECRPTRIACPCAKFLPVIIASDVRKFSYKTDGIGPRHALSKGITSATKAGIDLQWAPGVHCARCKLEGVVLYPVSLDRDMKEADRATPINVLLCGPCRDGVSPAQKELELESETESEGEEV